MQDIYKLERVAKLDLYDKVIGYVEITLVHNLNTATLEVMSVKELKD